MRFQLWERLLSTAHLQLIRQKLYQCGMLNTLWLIRWAKELDIILIELLFIYRISWLPIWEDKDEMDSVYGLLCDLLESNSPYVLGQEGSNLPRVVHIIAETLYRKSLADASTNRGRLLNLIRMIQNNPQMFQACVNSLAPELQQALQAALQCPS